MLWLLLITSFISDDSWTLFPFLPHSCSLTSLEPHGGCKDNPGIAVCMLSSSVVVAAEEVQQHHVILDGSSCFDTNCHSKFSNLFERCWNGLLFWFLRGKVHWLTSQANTMAWSAPYWVYLHYAYSWFELCTLRVSIGLVPKKSGSRVSPKTKKKLYLSAVIAFHTHLTPSWTPSVALPCRTSSAVAVWG